MHSEEQKSVLVSGGRGFIGHATVKLLQRSGYRVLSLDLGTVIQTQPVTNSQQIQCDLEDVGRLQDVFERNRISGIIHLAAILPTAAQRNPLLATQVNISGTVNLLEMARRFRVERFVFGSSLSIYGTYPAEHVVSEGDATVPEDLYGAAKLYVEQMGRAYRESYGLDFISLRIGRVVGPGTNSMSSAWRSEIFELLTTDHPAEICVPYRPSERILVVHVDDVAQMLLALLSASSTKQTIYNAPCSAIVVEDLKRVVVHRNPRLTLRLGQGIPVGNPRALDFSRFENEFDFKIVPIFDRLRKVN